MEELIAFDGQQELHFTGEALATASSRSTRPRWIELTLYRTEAGNYVLQGVGETTVEGEEVRRWAHVAEDPAGIIETLTMTDPDSVRYLTNVSKELLERASEADEKVRHAYRVRSIA